MTPTKVLVGQALVVFTIIIGGLWISTQWAAAMLGYQWRLGPPWFWVFPPPEFSCADA